MSKGHGSGGQGTNKAHCSWLIAQGSPDTINSLPRYDSSRGGRLRSEFIFKPHSCHGSGYHISCKYVENNIAFRHATPTEAGSTASTNYFFTLLPTPSSFDNSASSASIVGSFPCSFFGRASVNLYPETPMGFLVSRRAYSAMSLFFVLQRMIPMLG